MTHSEVLSSVILSTPTFSNAPINELFILGFHDIGDHQGILGYTSAIMAIVEDYRILVVTSISKISDQALFKDLTDFGQLYNLDLAVVSNKKPVPNPKPGLNWVSWDNGIGGGPPYKLRICSFLQFGAMDIDNTWQYDMVISDRDNEYHLFPTGLGSIAIMNN